MWRETCEVVGGPLDGCVDELQRQRQYVFRLENGERVRYEWAGTLTKAGHWKLRYAVSQPVA